MQSALKQAGRAVREIRLVLCQTGPGSAGVRDFIRDNYSILKEGKADIVIRECSQAVPTLTMRFDYGVEKEVSLDRLSSNDIESRVAQLARDSERINKNL
jgi:NADH dehydrogenase (ubiquinone) 1 alpha subcomplex subunit 2